MSRKILEKYLLIVPPNPEREKLLDSCDLLSKHSEENMILFLEAYNDLAPHSAKWESTFKK